MPTGKILIIRGGAIGDFILTLPVLAALRDRFPDVHRELLGYPRVTSLAVAGGLVHRAQSIEARALASFFARKGELPPELSDYFADFALIVSYLYDPDQIFRENVARCSAAQFVIGPHRPDGAGTLHATEAFLQPLETLAIYDPDPVPRLNLVPGERAAAATGPGARRDEADAYPARWLALHPGSGSERKNWPEEKWSNLVQTLVRSTHAGLLLVGGEAEGERLARVAKLVPPNRREIWQSRPLVELAGALQACQGFIGHDSGISHLAAALGVPGVILWGDTNQHVWRPRLEQIRILASPDGLAALSVDQVIAAVPSEWLS